MQVVDAAYAGHGLSSLLPSAVQQKAVWDSQENCGVTEVVTSRLGSKPASSQQPILAFQCSAARGRNGN